MNYMRSILYFLVCVFFIPVSVSVSYAKLPFVIISVDVETKKYSGVALPLPEQVNAVCAGDESCGLQKMVHILQEKGYAATFFYDVYEYKKYDEEAVKNIAIWLDRSGQDVQLHTHPHWAYDKNRNLMYQYSLEEQIEIIRDGKMLLEKWIGKPVVAHRAGAYGANENTLRALIENEIFYDSSLFLGWRKSRINDLDLNKNVLSMYDVLYQFPVTVYKKNEYPSLFVDNVKPIMTIRKYDVNWFADELEAENALNEAIHIELDFIMLFLHSFSFIKDFDNEGEKKTNSDAMKIFEKLLNTIKREGLKVITFGDIAKTNMNLSQYLEKPDLIPEIKTHISTVQYVRKRLGINKDKFILFVITIGIAGAMIATVIIVLKRRKA